MIFLLLIVLKQAFGFCMMAFYIKNHISAIVLLNFNFSFLSCFQVDDKLHDHKEESLIIVGSDLVSKIQLLETELAEALEANNMYKLQLKR